MRVKSNRLILIGVVLLTVCFSALKNGNIFKPRGIDTASSTADQTVAKAFQQRRSNIQVKGEGVVSKILADDNKGSRHQRFVARLSSGHTVLIAHNIDLALRIDALKVGDPIEFYGEYEWNAQGGVIHWTHHDPQRRHVGGWLKHNGKTFQ